MSAKDRALEIIQASLYTDPMNDVVQDVKDLLKGMDEVESSLLIGIAAGVPMQIYRDFFSYKITEMVRDASENFLKEVDEIYG